MASRLKADTSTCPRIGYSRIQWKRSCKSRKLPKGVHEFVLEDCPKFIVQKFPPNNDRKRKPLRFYHVDHLEWGRFLLVGLECLDDVEYMAVCSDSAQSMRKLNYIDMDEWTCLKKALEVYEENRKAEYWIKHDQWLYSPNELGALAARDDFKRRYASFS